MPHEEVANLHLSLSVDLWQLVGRRKWIKAAAVWKDLITSAACYRVF
jgi:hypothetical protein